ncbi:hypothetical protein BV20DRAFT_973654 [Pilatotrama ljubarskyi]|nr:hypothetical protein BV20DRAFT_973654 [Pilatotrama ljubarskyi]
MSPVTTCVALLCQSTYNVCTDSPCYPQPLGVSAVWPYFQQVIIVIILTRFMLDLRGVATNADEPATTLRWSELRFRTITATILGNVHGDADEDLLNDTDARSLDGGEELINFASSTHNASAV